MLDYTKSRIVLEEKGDIMQTQLFTAFNNHVVTFFRHKQTGSSICFMHTVILLLMKCSKLHFLCCLLQSVSVLCFFKSHKPSLDSFRTILRSNDLQFEKSTALSPPEGATNNMKCRIDRSFLNQCLFPFTHIH